MAVGLAFPMRANAERQPVLLVREGRLYAAWPGGPESPAGSPSAAPGRRAHLLGPSGERLAVLEAAWLKDDMAAWKLLEPTSESLVLVDSLARSGSALWIEPIEEGSTGLAGVHGTLRVPLGAPPATLDPALVTSLAEKQVTTQIFEGLVRLDRRLVPGPSGARSFEQDGVRYVFHLRDDARFHHGRPVRAADVVASLERVLAPAVRAPRVLGLADAIEGAEAYRTGHAKTIAGLRVIDSLTVEITASRPAAPLLLELASPAAFLVPVELLEKSGEPVGSGPFRFLRADSTAIVLAAAPGRTSGLDTLVFRRVQDPGQAVLDFELGRLDVVSPPETEERRLRASDASPPEVLSVDEASTYYLGFNTRAPFLREVRTRRALAGAIDRALAVRVLVPGRGRLARGLLPPVFGVSAPPESTWRASRFEAESKARGLAAGAPPLSFWVPGGSEAGLRFAEFVAASLRRLGYRVTVVVRPWAAFERGVLDGRADLFYLSWFADGPDPVSFVAALVESRRRGAGGNRTFYSNTEVDAALTRARIAATPGEALAEVNRAERIALSDAPLVPLFHSVNVTLVRRGITGLVLDPLAAPRYKEVEVRPGR